MYRILILSLLIAVCTQNTLIQARHLNHPLLDTLKSQNCDAISRNLEQCELLKHQLIKEQDISSLSEYYLNMGKYEMGCSSNFLNAKKNFELATVTALKNNDTTSIASVHICLFRLFKITHQTDSAYRHLNLLLSKHRNIAEYQTALGEAGLFYHELGDDKKALLYYDSLLQLLSGREANNKLNQGDSLTYIATLLNICDIYLGINEYAKALQNYRRSVDLGKRMNNPLAGFYGTFGIGKTYMRQGRYDSSIAFLQQALDAGLANKQLKTSSEVANTLAECYLQQGLTDKAQLYSNKSRELAQTKQYDKMLARCEITDGRICLHNNNYAAAISFFSKGLEGALKTHEPEIEKSAYECLSEAYTHLNRPVEALENYKKFVALKDSINSVEKANDLLRMDLEATFGRKQLADSIAHENSAAQMRLQLQRQTLVTYGSFIGIALVCVLAFFIYRNYTTQKKYNQLLHKEKQGHLAHIEEQSNVLSDIAWAQAHNIRGPLTTLLGLAQILNTDDPTDPENKEILEGIVTVTQRLDDAVKEVIGKENKLSLKDKQNRKGA